MERTSPSLDFSPKDMTDNVLNTFDCLKLVSMTDEEVRRRMGYGKTGRNKRPHHNRIKHKPTLKKVRPKKVKYKEYIISSEWCKRAEKIKENQHCFTCGSGNNLTVHHITYKNLGQEKKEDLVVVCWKCHQDIHNLALNDKGIKLKIAHEVHRKLLSLAL